MSNFITDDFEEFPELLEASYDGENYYVCELKRGEENGGVARIFMINSQSGELTKTVYLNYTLNLPSNEKIIDYLFKGVGAGADISSIVSDSQKRKRLENVSELLNRVGGRR